MKILSPCIRLLAVAAWLSSHHVCQSQFVTISNNNDDVIPNQEHNIGNVEISGSGGTDGQISPKCAAVLLAGSGVVGAASFMLTPTMLCIIMGFCPTGVASGSFASWWQSTMPLVAKGSAFAKLQSIAMGGSAGSMTALKSVMGGVGALYLKMICDSIDEVDPESAMGKSIDSTHYAVTTAIEAVDKVSAQCALSETCSASKEMVVSAADVIAKTAAEAIDATSKGASSLHNAAKEGGASGMKKEIDDQCAASELCTYSKEKAGEVIDGFTKVAWYLWRATKEGVSAMTTRINVVM